MKQVKYYILNKLDYLVGMLYIFNDDRYYFTVSNKFRAAFQGYFREELAENAD